MSSFRIAVVTQFSPALLQAVSMLIPQLSSSGREPTVAELNAIVESPATHLFLASDGETIVGMLTLVLVQIPSGLRAVIEDVVVAHAHRRQGLGEALNRAAIDFATKSGARTIDLTSRPSRTAAIRLYERLGFQRRETG